MVQLLDSDIETREVLDWKGVHILHFAGSSCSQKLRVFLNLKGIPWQSHPVDLPGNENFRPWFLGINPRGLVPVLVHDGAVHIESNDIISHLERVFPEPRLIPEGHETEVAALLHHEDDLHLDLRTLSFRFVFAPPGPPKPAEALASYAATGSGTVRGEVDRHKQAQIEFWQRAARDGFTDEQARASAQKFRAEFDKLDRKLSQQPYLMGDSVERARHRLADLRAPAVARRLSVRPSSSARRRLEGAAVGAAGVRQGDRNGAPFARATRRHPPRPGAGGQDLAGGRRVLAVEGPGQPAHSVHPRVSWNRARDHFSSESAFARTAEKFLTVQELSLDRHRSVTGIVLKI